MNNHNAPFKKECAIVMTDYVQHWQTCAHLIVSGMMNTNEGYGDFTPVANAISQNYSTVQKSFFLWERLDIRFFFKKWLFIGKDWLIATTMMEPHLMCAIFGDKYVTHSNYSILLSYIIGIFYVFHNEGEHAGCIWCVRLMGQRRRCAGSSTRLPPKSTLADIEMCRRA